MRRSAYIGTAGRISGSAWGNRTKQKKKRKPPIVLPWSKALVKNATNLALGGRYPGLGSQVRYSRTRKMDVTVKPVGTGSSYSYFRSNARPQRGSRIVKTQQAPLYSVYNSGSRLSSIQGQQAYAQHMAFRPTDLRTLYLETSSNNDGSFWVDSCRFRMMIQNQSEANTFVTIYEFVSRRDSAVNPSTAFSAGMLSIQAGATSTAEDIGATPFMSSRFTTNFRILKKYNVELAQGRTHIHTSYYQLNKKYSDSLYQMELNDDLVYGGWTRGVFIIAHGSPYNSAATKTNVSTTPVALDFVINKTYCTHSNLANKAVFEVQTDFPTFADGQIIDIGSGEADTVTDA